MEWDVYMMNLTRAPDSVVYCRCSSRCRISRVRSISLILKTEKFLQGNDPIHWIYILFLAPLLKTILCFHINLPHPSHLDRKSIARIDPPPCGISIIIFLSPSPLFLDTHHVLFLSALLAKIHTSGWLLPTLPKKKFTTPSFEMETL